MEVYEITGFETGVSKAGVNVLQPIDSFQNIQNGFVHRQVLQSRQGLGFFAPRLSGNTRIFGIFEHTLPDSTKQLLAFDQNFLYLYNTATGVFDQKGFGGSMVGYTGFNISAKDLYISGTSYPVSALLSTGLPNPKFVPPGSRFIFTSPGITPNANGSQIFFWNGTDVEDYTNVVDNPNFVNPLQGTLVNAKYVLWFNERLNFISPKISGTGQNFNQGVLFSGIRTIAGNGDNFNVAGSGLFQADTYQDITGASIMGQVMVLNFNRMAYTLEKTTDAFNPYYGRTVPGVLGTNADFSAVSWDDEVNSVGKTGTLVADGRQNLRSDNKIPDFTRDVIDQKLFNLTYGGFDRVNAQILWAYVNSESGSLTQNGVLVKNYEENSWSTFDMRISCFGQTDLGIDLTWNQIDEITGDPSWARWDTTLDIWDRIGLGVSVQKTLVGDDLGFIYDINKDFFDYLTPITEIIPGSTTTLTVAANGIIAGDFVSVSNVGGMIQLNNYDDELNILIGDLYLVLTATPTSIVLDVDSTLFSNYTSGGIVNKAINFYAETIPFNPYRSQGYRCYISHIDVLLEGNGGFLNVDVFADQDETPFIQDVPLQIPLIGNFAQWVSMSVNQESDFLTFALKQTSPSVQCRIESIKLYCSQGGRTNG